MTAREQHRPHRAIHAIIVAVLLLSLAAVGYGAWWVWLNAFTRPYSQELLREQWSADGTLEMLRSYAHRLMSGTEPLPTQKAQWPKVSPSVYIGTLFRDADGSIKHADKLRQVADQAVADDQAGLTEELNPDKL